MVEVDSIIISQVVVEERKEEKEKEKKNKEKKKPDHATMCPGCVSACIDWGARLGRTDK